MKIAVPLDNDRVNMHFGHCAAFAIYDVDETDKKTVTKTVIDAPPHEPGLLPRWLHEQGAHLIIAGGMGHRAQELFVQNGIQVIVGAPPELADDVVAAFINGSLKAGTNVCDH